MAMVTALLVAVAAAATVLADALLTVSQVFPTWPPSRIVPRCHASDEYAVVCAIVVCFIVRQCACVQWGLLFCVLNANALSPLSAHV